MSDLHIGYGILVARDNTRGIGHVDFHNEHEANQGGDLPASAWVHRLRAPFAQRVVDGARQRAKMAMDSKKAAALA